MPSMSKDELEAQQRALLQFEEQRKQQQAPQRFQPKSQA